MNGTINNMGMNNMMNNIGNDRQTFNIKISEQKYIKEAISLMLKILVNKNQQNNIRKRKIF
jgi:hypothetical protein